MRMVSASWEVSEVDELDRARTLNGLVNQVTYGIDIGGPGTPDIAHRRAAEIVDGALFSQSPATYYEVIVAGLRSEQQWQDPDALPLREFLSQLVAELDRLRPWPESAFEVLREPELAEALWTAPVVGYLSGTFRTIATSLRGFSFAYRRPDGGALLIVALRSGEVLGLRGAGPQEPRVALVLDSPSRDAVLAFTRATGIPVGASE